MLVRLALRVPTLLSLALRVPRAQGKRERLVPIRLSRGLLARRAETERQARPVLE